LAAGRASIQLVANLFEPASSGRASCRGCGGKIAKGELRFGECKPNPFGEGDATYWFHPLCAACMRPEEFLAALTDCSVPLDDRDWLLGAAQAGMAHPRLARLLRAERSPSSRARCRSCRELIEKGSWRIALGIFQEGRLEPIGFIHVACAGTYFETRDVIDRVTRLSPELTQADRVELSKALHATEPADGASQGPGLSKAGESPAVLPAKSAAGSGSHQR
jgi:hypothetical protein